MEAKNKSFADYTAEFPQINDGKAYVVGTQAINSENNVQLIIAQLKKTNGLDKSGNGNLLALNLNLSNNRKVLGWVSINKEIVKKAIDAGFKLGLTFTEFYHKAGITTVKEANLKIVEYTQVTDPARFKRNVADRLAAGASTPKAKINPITSEELTNGGFPIYVEYLPWGGECTDELLPTDGVAASVATNVQLTAENILG